MTVLPLGSEEEGETGSVQNVSVAVRQSPLPSLSPPPPVTSLFRCHAVCNGVSCAASVSDALLFLLIEEGGVGISRPRNGLWQHGDAGYCGGTVGSDPGGPHSVLVL
ncbi:hypothetical protein SKAU_G00076220 [Synaphobranchus kaupii]|uniref:Uncharacterized protein n=1 Tax=Synaphobranchus kaupii TaxID=118154 RepID=A0A9Q1JC82_SYNKA|nr:hypothetical protein SKAU_G00076220 [Synaphobranchus kaupii]